MQGSPFPTECDEASVPTEHVRNGPNLNRTFTVRHKAAKRTLPWDLTVDEIQLALPRPQDEDIRETKRPRLEEPVHTSTDEATTKNTSHGIVVALPPPAPTSASADNEDAANTDSMTHTNGCTGKWKEDEDIKLKHSLQMHGGKSWFAIDALVPGRTNVQCYRRWYNVLDSSIDQVNGRTGKWKEDEDINLKDAVQKHSGKDWVAIAALVPGRTRKQCQERWHNALIPSIDQMTARLGKWADDEDIMQYSTVARIGPQLLRWFQVENINSVKTDGTGSWILASTG